MAINNVSTYLELYKALSPLDDETRPAWKRNAFIVACLLASGGLLFWSRNAGSLLLAWAPLFPLLAMSGVVIASIVAERRRQRSRFGDPRYWDVARLDQRVEQEKAAAVELAQFPLWELKWMAQRLDAEALAQERWTDVLKPLSMVFTAALLVIGLDLFPLPAFLQWIGKLVAAAMLFGVAVGAVSIYEGVVRLRRLSSAMHYAIADAEGRKTPDFRKVSRKRGQK